LGFTLEKQEIYMLTFVNSEPQTRVLFTVLEVFIMLSCHTCLNASFTVTIIFVCVIELSFSAFFSVAEIANSLQTLSSRYAETGKKLRLLSVWGMIEFAMDVFVWRVHLIRSFSSRFCILQVKAERKEREALGSEVPYNRTLP
jgi:hypothetical protein